MKAWQFRQRRQAVNGEKANKIFKTKKKKKREKQKGERIQNVSKTEQDTHTIKERREYTSRHVV